MCGLQRTAEKCSARRGGGFSVVGLGLGDEGITLSVVIVDEFTDAASADEWVEQTWLASGMGSSDALLAVAEGAAA